MVNWRDEYDHAPRYHRTQDGSRMHYVDVGEGAPLLFVHGNPTWGFYWRHLVDRFRTSHRCIAPDHVGMGLSDKPEAGRYRLEQRIEDLVSLVEALDLRDMTVVVHDWGGAIGLGMAGRMPERVRSLVITNTGAFPSRHMPTRIAMCRVPVLGPLAVRGFNGFAAAAIHMATERGLSPVARAGLLAPYGNWSERVAIQRFVEDIPRDASHPSWATLLGVEAGLERLADRPALIAWGTKDWCFTTEFRDGFARRLPRARVVNFDDAGHYLCEDAREGLADEVARHLGERG
jgi:haloalkane dehalogenase